MALKKTNGLYRGKVRIGVTQDGKPIDKYVSGKTVKELETVKEAARDHFIYGRAIPKDIQFFEYAEQWYKLKKEPFISAASRASYRLCQESFAHLSRESSSNYSRNAAVVVVAPCGYVVNA